MQPTSAPRTFALRTASDLLEKLRRDGARVRAGGNSDDVFNFIVTAYSLVDWVKNDSTIPAHAKVDLSRLRASRTARVCRDIANSGKHFELDPRRNPTPMVVGTEATNENSSYTRVRDNMLVHLSDGTSLSAEKLVEDILREWEAFFAVNDLTRTSRAG